MTANAGKSIWLISATQTEWNQAVADGFNEAAKAAHLTSKYVVASGQLNQENQLVQEAVSAQAAGIVLFNITPQSVSKPLENAKAAGITVIDLNNGSPDDPLNGVFAHVTGDYRQNGRSMADWMLADSKCDLHLATFELPTIPVSSEEIEATNAEVKKLCPWCTVNNNNMDLATFATSLGPLAVTTTQRDPKINYMDPGFDSFITPLAPSLEQIGSRVKLVGNGGNASNLANLRAKKGLQVMSNSPVPQDYIGWTLVDALGRGMAKQKAVGWTLPSRIVDATTIGTDDASIFPDFKGFQSLFLKAWGLS